MISRGTLQANMLDDLLAQPDNHIGVSGQFVESPREGGGCGVTAGQENSDELIAEDLPVASERCQCMKESVTFFRFGLSGELFGRETECLFNVWVDEFVDDFDTFVEGPAGDERIQRSATHQLTNIQLLR